MEDLLGKAFAFKKTKIWEKLWDDQIFAIRHSDGSTGYVCIMGRAGLCRAVAVYPGTEGLDSMRRVNSCPEDAPEQVEFEVAMAQDNVSCSFVGKDLLGKSELKQIRAYCSEHGINLRGKDAWPQLESKKPYHMPWPIREESDKKHLGEALDACVDLAGKLKGRTVADFSFAEGGLKPGTVVPLARVLPDGSFQWETTALPKPKAVQYRTAVPFDKKLAAEAGKAEENGQTWMCDVVLSPGAVLDKDEDEKALDKGAEPEFAPFFPLAQLILRGDEFMSAHLCDQSSRYDESFLGSALNDMIENGRPAEIVVRNERTFSIYRKLADDLGIRLTMKDDCPELDELVEHFYREFGRGNAADGGPGLSREDVASLAAAIETAVDFSEYADEEILTLYLAANSLNLNLSKSQMQKLEDEFINRFEETEG